MTLVWVLIDLSLCQAGAVAGLSVDLMFYPIDTIKTRLQSQQGFVKAGGFKGIYKGVGSVGVGSAPGGAIIPSSSAMCRALLTHRLFSSCCVLYRLRESQAKPAEAIHILQCQSRSHPHVCCIRRRICEWLSYAQLNKFADSSDYQMACLIRVPTEIVKSRTQTSAYGAGTSSLSSATNVLKYEGFRGFYRGFGITLAREVSLGRV
jgi:solute carrier family 25 S-adenosylmethionine transporter 26